MIVLMMKMMVLMMMMMMMNNGKTSVKDASSGKAFDIEIPLIIINPIPNYEILYDKVSDDDINSVPRYDELKKQFFAKIRAKK